MYQPLTDFLRPVRAYPPYFILVLNGNIMIDPFTVNKFEDGRCRTMMRTENN